MALLGNWTLAGVAEEPRGILRLAPDQIQLFGRCGILVGSWRADAGGFFVAGMFGSTGAEGGRGCDSAPGQNPQWLNRVTSYQLEGETPLLLDADGAVVARLLPGATPTPGPYLAASEVGPPEITDEVRRRFAPAAALPATLTPATRDRLVGKWVPVSGPRRAYVEFKADGEWRGSDGCNGQAGRWVVDPAGAFLATTGPSTLIGCDGVPVGAWLSSSWRAGLDGKTLVLLDAQAKEAGRLRRAG
ncbi:META domain-containing protein [Micromonospora sp. DR5-3]|uniref:hypothetical protein n=1 Tax=unclassified Micromonospora TaxID=2617518 RepID=UPI0011D542CC|nr:MULTISPECIES: hypothetical protein [unclassified Micromonospora]MCW3814081.1 META domain-containing protein [Micromonospora sp. DR5-3]TYC23572.1 hypothetical protein FXF52_14455 [Micromonospora sp. MP36]